MECRRRAAGRAPGQNTWEPRGVIAPEAPGGARVDGRARRRAKGVGAYRVLCESAPVACLAFVRDALGGPVGGEARGGRGVRGAEGAEGPRGAARGRAGDGRARGDGGAQGVHVGTTRERMLRRPGPAARRGRCGRAGLAAGTRLLHLRERAGVKVHNCCARGARPTSFASFRSSSLAQRLDEHAPAVARARVPRARPAVGSACTRQHAPSRTSRRDSPSRPTWSPRASARSARSARRRVGDVKT